MESSFIPCGHETRHISCGALRSAAASLLAGNLSQNDIECIDAVLSFASVNFKHVFTGPHNRTVHRNHKRDLSILPS